MEGAVMRGRSDVEIINMNESLTFTGKKLNADNLATYGPENSKLTHLSFYYYDEGLPLNIAGENLFEKSVELLFDEIDISSPHLEWLDVWREENEGLNVKVNNHVQDEIDFLKIFPDNFKPRDYLAFYRPAHIANVNEKNEVEDYGIFFIRDRMFRAVTELPQNRSWDGMDQKLKEKYRRLFFYKVFIHELCHAWVEDLVSKVCIENDVDKTKPPYKETLKNYKGYIPMEEALCNTAAYGYLYNLEPVDNSCDEIKEEIFSWMRGQPEGYRDFKEIKEEPGKSEHFQKLVCLLLKTCYGLQYDNVQGIVKEYFSNESFKKSKVPLDFIPRFKEKQFDPKNTGDEKINRYIKANYEIDEKAAVVAAYKDNPFVDLLVL